MKKMVLVSALLLTAGIRHGLAAEACTLPPAVVAQMKPGRRVTRLYLSPGFPALAAQGIRVGQVGSTVQHPFLETMLTYLPTALNRLAKPEAANVLSLTLTELSSRENVLRDQWSTAIGVEGQVLDPDGKLLAAFITREEASDLVGTTRNGRLAIDRIVATLARELGLPLAPSEKARVKLHLPGISKPATATVPSGPQDSGTPPPAEASDVPPAEASDPQPHIPPREYRAH